MANIAKILILSTAHLSQETLDTIQNVPSDDWAHAGNKIDYGMFMYAHDEKPEYGDGDRHRVCPDDVWNACVKARELGCDYLKFDCDGETVEGLAIYEHRIGG